MLLFIQKGCGGRNMLKKLFFIVGVLLVLSGIMGGVAYGMVYVNSANRVAFSMNKFYSKGNYQNISMTMKYQLKDMFYEEMMKDEDFDSKDIEGIRLFANQLVDQVTFKAQIQSDLDEDNFMMSDFTYDFKMFYGVEQIADSGIKLFDKQLEITSKGLMDQSFYIAFEDLRDELEIDIDKIDFQKYAEIISESTDRFKKIKTKAYFDKYTELYEDKIQKGDKVLVDGGNGKEIQCLEYTISYEYESMLDFIEEILEMAAEDVVLEEAVRLTLLDLCNELMDSKDYRSFKINRKELDQLIETLEDQDDFHDEFEDVFEKIIDEMFQDTDQEPEGSTFDMKKASVEITYAIDYFNNIRKITSKTENDLISLTTESIYLTGAVPSIEPIETDGPNAINIMEYMDADDDKASMMATDVLKSVGKHLKENKAIDLIMADIKENIPLLPLELQEEAQMMIDEVINKKAEMIDTYIEQGIGYFSGE